MKKTISIIVPIYNIENYLERCIESLIKQTYRNIEIILIDDGSTDNSGIICDKYAKKDSRIKAIHKKNGGLVSARKTGVCNATGDYICSVDGDDWIEPNRIYNLNEQITLTDADMIYMEGYYKDYDTRTELIEEHIPVGLFSGKQIIQEIFPLIIDTHVCFLRAIRAMQVCWGIKKTLYQKMCMQNDERISMGEDYSQVLMCLLDAKSVYLMKERGYHYVMRPNSIMHKLNKDSIDTIKIWFQALKKQMEIKNCWTYLHLNIVFLAMWYVLNCDYKMFLNYGYEYLYPYPKVKKGSCIAVYGAGTVGTQIVEALDSTDDYKIAIWVDKYNVCHPSQHHKVKKINDLLTTKFDYLIIAVLDVKIVLEIEKNLLELGIPQYKIAKMDANVICEEALPHDFFTQSKKD